MVGENAEHGGIAKNGAKLVNAVATSKVPKITLLIGGSFGAGNYGMCGRAYDPRFLFSWPNAKMSVMGGEQAARTMAQVAMEGAEKKGMDPKKIYGENLEMLEGMKKKIIDQYREEGEAIFCSARRWG